MSSASNQPQAAPAAGVAGARGPGHNRRLMHALGASVAAAGLVGVLFNHKDLTPITPSPPGADRPPVHASQQPSTTLNSAPTTTTTTTVPPTTAAPTTTTTAPKAAPAGTHASPEEAAQAWWGVRLKVDAEQVVVRQRDRRTRDTFRVMVSATNGGKVHSGLLKVVRVGGNYWRCEGFYQEAS